MAQLADEIKKELNLNIVEPIKKIGGGCNGENWLFNTNIGRIFAKTSSEKEANILLCGELASLEALQTSNTVLVPKPIRVISCRTATVLVTTYVEFKSLNRFQGDLGSRLAKLHLHNINLLKENSPSAVQKFGFNTNVCCGKIPIDNSWNTCWVDFYVNQRLAPQVDMILKKFKTKEILDLWELLRPKVPKLFDGITILPSLLHGDLWSGNAGETQTEPIIFDPASFYGHHEFDLAITRIFGGFDSNFDHEYHRLIPREDGFDERKNLYELFHYLNHWNHFGGSYERQSLNMMRKLVKNIK